MSWMKVPKGSFDDLKGVPRMVVFYFVLPIAFLAILGKLWRYLEVKLEGRTDPSPSFFQSIQGGVGSAGQFLLDWIPYVIGGAVGLTILYFLIKWFLYAYYRKQALNGVRYVQILPSDDIRLEVDKVTVLTRSFGGMIRHLPMRLRFGNPWFRIRFAIPEGSTQIGIYMSFPRDKWSSVLNTIRSVYPTAEIHELEPDQFPGPKKHGAGGHFFYQKRRKGLPLASLEQKKETPLGSILNCLRPGTFLDLQFSPVSWRQLEERSEEVLDDLKDKKMADLDPEEKARRVSLMKRLTGREITFRVRLTLWSNHKNASAIVRSTSNAIETAMNYDGAIRFWMQRRWNPLNDTNPIPLPIPRTMMVWTGEELSNLFHLPPGDHWIYQEPDKNEPDPRGYLVHLSHNQRSLAEDELREGVLLGRIQHPLHEREVRVPYKQLSNHFIITGASGMGKSSSSVEILQSMVDDWVKDPEKHPGFTLLDPAREIIAVIENRLRTLEESGEEIPKSKIHHINLSSDATHMVGLNLLHKEKDVSIHELAERAANVILHKAGTSEPILRMKRVLTLAIHSLMEDDRPRTLLDIDEFLRNPEFRQTIVEKGKDPYVKRFWTKINELDLKRDAEPILNKIELLIQDPTMRRMFLQPEMALEIERYMDEGHLVFIDLFGMKDHELKVTVGHLVNQYHETAKKRPPDSKFHLMMIDEAHLVQIPLFTEILLEDRRYDWGIGLITRDIDQVKNEAFSQAVKANIGAILSCAQNEGSDEVQNLTRDHIQKEFVESLPERNVAVYVRTKKNNRSHVSTCVVTNRPPVVFLPDGREADHRTAEKEEAYQWGLEWGLEQMRKSPVARSIEEVDKQINQYMDPDQGRKTGTNET